jgi:hydrogenase nickel incorporation protein HypA/HybF
MHEMSLVQSILDIVFEEAQRHHVQKITAVNLVVGRLTAVVPEQMKFAFEMLTEDTPAAGAELNLEFVPAGAVCSQCGHEYVVNDSDFLCPQCRGPGLVKSGRELQIASIEGE